MYEQQESQSAVVFHLPVKNKRSAVRAWNALRGLVKSILVINISRSGEGHPELSGGKSAIVIPPSIGGFQESTATEISFRHAQVDSHRLQPSLAEKGSVLPVKAFGSNPRGSVSQN